MACKAKRFSEEQDRDSFFGNWWLFDTNCISELVKMWNKGQDVQVQKFPAAKNILLTSGVIQELRKAPEILRTLDSALEDARLFVAPDMRRFWHTDILNFQNRKPQSCVNSLQVQPVLCGLFKMVLEGTEFEEACLQAEIDVQNRFFSTIEPDIGSNLDERDLCISIFRVVNKLGKKWFQIEIRPEDCTPASFPSFYTFYYTYYFRYTKNQVNPEINDFIDLANCLALPYCERYYGERKFTTILRDYVQGRRPPTAFQLVKRLYKKGEIDGSSFQVIKRHKSMFSRTSSLLPGIEIFNLAEMRAQIQNAVS